MGNAQGPRPSQVHQVPGGQREPVEGGDLSSGNGAARTDTACEPGEELRDRLLPLVLHPRLGLGVARQDAVPIGFDVVLAGLVEVGEPQRHIGRDGSKTGEQVAKSRVPLRRPVKRRVSDDHDVRPGDRLPAGLHHVVDRRAEVRASVRAPRER